ncbi:MAG: hypothetical protein ACMG6E_06810 [Candidatus Roizmanbacteria bacterium]
MDGADGYPVNPTNKLWRRLERQYDGLEMDQNFEDDECDIPMYEDEDAWYLQKRGEI